jgi:hypothetical protein
MSTWYRISVIMPCFNDGVFLPEVVASVRNAECDDMELILVDGVGEILGSGLERLCCVAPGYPRHSKRAFRMRQPNPIMS